MQEEELNNSTRLNKSSFSWVLLLSSPSGWGLIIWAPYVRSTEVYGSNSLKLYTKIRYGLRIMHVK